MGSQGGGGGNTGLDFTRAHTHTRQPAGEGIFLLHVFSRQCTATLLGGTAEQGL